MPRCRFGFLISALVVSLSLPCLGQSASSALDVGPGIVGRHSCLLPHRLLIQCAVFGPASMVHMSGQTAAATAGSAVAELKLGVVVEAVARNSEGEKAGVREGDMILGWERGDSKGPIESPFDLSLIEIEQAPLGNVKIEGLRGNEKQVWVMGPTDWGLTTRPNFDEGSLTSYREGEDLSLKSGGDAVKRWKELAGWSSSIQCPWLPAWLLFKGAGLLSDAKQWNQADDLYQSAVESASTAGPAVEGQLLRAWAKAYQQRSDWAEAEKYFQQATAKMERAGGQLQIAANLSDLGKISRQRGNLDKAEQYHRQALEIQKKVAPTSLNVADSLNNLGRVAYDRGDLAGAQQYFRQALQMQEKLAPESLDVATSLNNLGGLEWRRGDLAQAERYFQQALGMAQRLAPESLNVATSLTNLGILGWRRGDLAQAEQYSHQALVIREKRVPGSLDVAVCLNNLGLLAYARGDLVQAAQYHGQALEIREKLAPGSLVMAASFSNLGIVAAKRGDLVGAEHHFELALDIEQKLAPGSPDVADALINLGNVVGERGDLAKEEQYHRRALEIYEKLAPASLDVADSLNNLGNEVCERGDLPKAEQYHRQALEIYEKLAPGSLDMATSLGNLGYVALKRGQLANSKRRYQEALEIREKLAPLSLDVALSLANLGDVAYEQRDWGEAERYHRQAFAIYEKLAPESVYAAGNIRRLGDLARKSGDVAGAEQYYRRSVAILEKVAPGSKAAGESLAAAASVLREQQQPEVAAQFYARAIAALDSQAARLGGSEEARSGFRARYSNIYKDYIDLLVEQNHPEKALEALDGSRARILFETLVAAGVDIRKGADASLLQQERSLQGLLTAKSDRRLRLMAEKNNDRQVAVFGQEIEDLEKQYQEVEERLRVNSPAYAALTQPQPLTLTAIQQLLDHDTLLLEYSMGEERSYVFAVTQGSVNVYELPKRAEIERASGVVYQLVTARGTWARGETASQRQARWAKAAVDYAQATGKLSRMILAPVAQVIEGKRLLIVSDGALQYIPFAALPSPESTSGKKVPLIARHEIINLPSASVLAVLRQEAASHRAAGKSVIVIADPVFDAHDGRVRGVSTAAKVGADASDVPDRYSLNRSAREVAASRNGLFPRLVFSRREAEAIYATAPPGEAAEALDFDASKATAVSARLSEYRIVHLATHGLLNSEHPELSGLVFSLVDRQGHAQDGFLRLLDIYNLELNANLVVLSACQTALGKQVDGEGLIGLARGFMYAGSPRVVASLWKVDDEATAAFMGEFYEGVLKNGQSPAKALRAAQIWMQGQKRWKSPYFWAGFVLLGEWK